MKTVLSGISILAIGIGLGYYFADARPQAEVSTASYGVVKERSKSPDRIVTHQAAPSSSNDFTRIYGRLGLKDGDTIFDVNGVATPQGFLQIVSAYDSGNLCIGYERERLGRRRVCFSRNEVGERVVDSGSK